MFAGNKFYKMVTLRIITLKPHNFIDLLNANNFIFNFFQNSNNKHKDLKPTEEKHSTYFGMNNFVHTDEYIVCYFPAYSSLNTEAATEQHSTFHGISIHRVLAVMLT